MQTTTIQTTRRLSIDGGLQNTTTATACIHPRRRSVDSLPVECIFNTILTRRHPSPMLSLVDSISPYYYNNHSSHSTVVQRTATMPQERPTRKWAAAGALLLLIVLLSLLLKIDNIDEGLPPIHRQQLSSNHSLTADDAPAPDFWKYAYVIVTYHKSGHQLSHKLVGYLEKNQPPGGHLRRTFFKPRDKVNVLSKCSELSLLPETITVIEAPEFHCHEEQLANLLMHNPDPKGHQKWGVKIIHLVRNPFTMAVSNYHYHSQDPTPEPFVHWKNPCDSLTEKNIDNPILSHPLMRIPMDGKVIPVTRPIMTHDDFENMVNDCYSLYQTKPDLTTATYYQHLRALDPEEGLRIATTDKFNHIALMTSDLLMFNRVQQFSWTHQELHLITMPMDDWIERPGESMFKFLNFVFHDHIMPDQKKKTVSERYAKGFFKEAQESNHVTTGKFENTAELIESLRRDAVFGGPLRRIEALLEEVVRLENLE
ncbi:hypothetical protein ACHAXR_011856, partial [Thalassiosira sp. AJA248-18]